MSPSFWKKFLMLVPKCMTWHFSSLNENSLTAVSYWSLTAVLQVIQFLLHIDNTFQFLSSANFITTFLLFLPKSLIKLLHEINLQNQSQRTITSNYRQSLSTTILLVSTNLLWSLATSPLPSKECELLCLIYVIHSGLQQCHSGYVAAFFILFYWSQRGNHCYLGTSNSQSLYTQGVQNNFSKCMNLLSKQSQIHSGYLSLWSMARPSLGSSYKTDKKQSWELGPEGNLFKILYKMLLYWNIFKNCCHRKVQYWLGVFVMQLQRSQFKAWFYSTFPPLS